MNDINTEAVTITSDDVGTIEASEVAVPTAVPTLAESCQSLLELFDISDTGADVVACAMNMLDVAQEVTKLENIDFTSKAAINRSCTAARAATLDVIKKLTMIRKGGSISEIVGIDEATQDPIMEDVVFGGFMLLRDNASENVGEMNRKLALGNKRKELEALQAEIAALDAEEAEAGIE
jgi:hypothetical protein